MMMPRTGRLTQSRWAYIIIVFSVIWSTIRIFRNGLESSLPREQQLLDQILNLAPLLPTNRRKRVATTTRTAIYRPFANLTVELPRHSDSKSISFPYSSFSCVQQPPDESVYPDFVGRTCQFHNLYFDPHFRTFHYYMSPMEERLTRHLEQNDTATTLQILQNKMAVSWGFIATVHVQKRLSKKRIKYGNWNAFRWHPQIHLESDNTSTIPRWADLSWSNNPTTSNTTNPKYVFVLYHPSYSFNFGHFLLDDVAAWFQMLHMFGHIAHNTMDDDTTTTTTDTATTTIPIPVMVEQRGGDPLYRCTPGHRLWPSCVGIYRRLLPSLLHVQMEENIDILRLGNFLQNLPNHARHRRQQEGGEDNLWHLIRLEHVIVGSGRLAHFSCEGACAVGRVNWMPIFRRWLLHQLLSHGPGKNNSSFASSLSSSTPRSQDRLVNKAHDYITFSLAINNSRAAGLSNMSDIIKAAQARYGVRRVQTVNMISLTLPEQAWLMLHTCVFVTYDGGGSHTSIFLPPGATVVLYNSNSNFSKPKYWGYYRDKTWYDSMAQVQKVWVSREDRNNVTLAMDILQHHTEDSA